MNNNESDKECPECRNRFFLFSLRGVNGDLTISIPAEDESMAHSELDNAVQNPDAWVREKKLEDELGTRPTTGRRKEGVKEWHPPATDNPGTGPGPMFG